MTAGDGERIPGIAAPLPPGERVRWHGAPGEASLARHAFHVRKIAIYFALLLAWRGWTAVTGEAGGWEFFLAGAVPLTALGGAAVACSLALAKLTHRSAVYAITDRRVVMRTGLVLTSTINIPLRQVDAVALKRHEDGTGDIAIQLGPDDRLPFLLLWPHVRAWRLRHPQPVLRSVPDAAAVGELLRAELQALAIPPPAPRAAPRPAARAGTGVEALV